MDNRLQALSDWLQTHDPLPKGNLIPMAGDASFRRYFRVQHASQSFVAMDAPPPGENCLPFIAIAKGLRAAGLKAPEIIASDVQQGFLLLSDFGDDLYLKKLNAANAETLYDNALDALATLQACREIDWALPFFTADFMYQELQLFKEWFLQKHLGLSIAVDNEKMLSDFFHFLASSAATQPQVFMHRDFHSANLMVLSKNQVGILDFQDAFIGPVTYDLVSLLRDCYIAWPDALVKKLALQYKEKIHLQVRDELFLRWFDLMGVQRHLKALLTFSRKLHRDGNANYLQHMPRTIQYVANITPLYPETLAFNEFLNATILPAMKKVALCAQ